MARNTIRVKIDRNIYNVGSCIEVVAYAKGHKPRYKYYPLDTKLGEMQAWRDGTSAEMQSEVPLAAVRGTLRAVFTAYKKHLTPPGKTKPTGDLSQFSAWLEEHGDVMLRKLTETVAEQQFERWIVIGYKRQTLRLRRFAFQKLWRFAFGSRAKTPVDHIKMPKQKRQRPRGVSDEIIFAVLTELWKHEHYGWLKDAKSRARFLMLITTGQRPAQLKIMQKTDVDLTQGAYGQWEVRAVKGGEANTLPFNSEMRTAYDLFAAADAWGYYDTRSFARLLRRCGWPQGVRPYNVRHATGQLLARRGADIGDIQLHMTHSDMETTRTSYVPGELERQRAVSALLENRFAALSAPHGRPL